MDLEPGHPAKVLRLQDIRMDEFLNESQVCDLVKFFSLYYRYPTLVENVDNPSRVKKFRKDYRCIYSLDLETDSNLRRWIGCEASSADDMGWLMKLMHSDSEGVVFSIHDNKYAHKFMECLSYFPGRRDVIMIHGSSDSYIRKEYTSELKRNFPMAFIENKLGVIRATPSRIA